MKGEISFLNRIALVQIVKPWQVGQRIIKTADPVGSSWSEKEGGEPAWPKRFDPTDERRSPSYKEGGQDGGNTQLQTSQGAHYTHNVHPRTELTFGTWPQQKCLDFVGFAAFSMFLGKNGFMIIRF